MFFCVVQIIPGIFIRIKYIYNAMLMAIALMSVIKMSLNRLAFISSFIESSIISSVYVIETLMRTFQTVHSLFSSHIVQLCQDDNLILSSEVCLPVDSYTYLSEAWNTTSWLEHCIVQQMHMPR